MSRFDEWLDERELFLALAQDDLTLVDFLGQLVQKGAIFGESPFLFALE